MNRLLSAAAVLSAAFFASLAHGQVQGPTVTSSSIIIKGHAATGTVSFTPVAGPNSAVATGQPIPIMAAGTLYGQQSFSSPITAGVLPAGFNVPDMCVAVAAVANTSVQYNVVITDTASASTLTLPNVTGVCGSTFALDKYAPVQSAVVFATVVSTGSTVPSTCKASSLFYTASSTPASYGCVGSTYVPLSGNISGEIARATAAEQANALAISNEAAARAAAAPGTINAKAACGLHGDGATFDNAAAALCMTNNPNASIYFPAANYLFTATGKDANGNAASGFVPPTSFHGEIVLAPGARLVCDDPTIAAGQCVHVNGNTNIRFVGLHLAYTSATVLGRKVASPNNAVLVENSSNIRFDGLVVESSPGAGLWVSNSDNVTARNSLITNTSADGAHFENCGFCGLGGFRADNTGDDAIAFTNISTTGTRTGGFVSDAVVTNSHVRGFADAGQIGVLVNNLTINGTGYSGFAVIQDQSIASNTPSNVIASNVDVSHAGDGTVTPATGTTGNNYGFDIGLSTNVSLTNVHSHYSGGDGLYAYSGATGLNLQQVQFDHSANKGLEANGVASLHVNGATTEACAQGGYSFQNLTDSDLANIHSIRDTGYAIYLSGFNRVVGANWGVLDNTATNNGLSIAIQNAAGPLAVDLVTLADTGVAGNVNRPKALGWAIGGYAIGSYKVRMSNIVNMVLDATTNPFAIRNSGGANETYVQQ